MSYGGKTMLYIRKYVSVMLVLMLLFSPMGLFTVKAGAKPLSGSGGKNIVWWYNKSTKTLTFTGKGEMQDSFEGEMSWHVWKKEVRHVIVRDGITSVGTESFYKHKKLEDAVIGDSVKFINVYAFAYSGLKKVRLNKGLKYIWWGAFEGCKQLKKVSIPDTVKKIGEYAFSGCPLKSINLPDSLTDIGEGAFRKTDIESVTIPPKVDTVEKEVFYGCKSLKEIKLPGNLKTIEGMAFAKTGIEELIIPENVERFGRPYGWNEGIFEDCKNLKQVEVRSKKIEVVYDEALSNTPENVVFKVPSGMGSKYRELFRKGGLSANIVIEESTEW